MTDIFDPSKNQRLCIDYTEYDQWKNKKVNIKKNKKEIHTNIEENNDTKRFGSACSSTCLHGNRNFFKRENSPTTVVKEKRINELKSKLKSLKKSLEEYKLHRSLIMERNVNARKAIQNDDQQLFMEINDVHHKYMRYRKGIIQLNDRYMKEKSKLDKVIIDKKEDLNSSLLKIKNQVNQVSNQLITTRNNIISLNNFKDKEYPTNVIYIQQLEQKLQNLNLENENGDQELNLIIESEYSKIRKKEYDELYTRNQEVIENVFQKIHPSIEEILVENKQLIVDIDFHKQINRSLSNDINHLRKLVKVLKCDSKTNIRHQLFPELFNLKENCLPDMDIILDIPKPIELCF